MFVVFLSVLTLAIEHHEQVRGKVFLSAYYSSTPCFYTFQVCKVNERTEQLEGALADCYKDSGLMTFLSCLFCIDCLFYHSSTSSLCIWTLSCFVLLPLAIYISPPLCPFLLSHFISFHLLFLQPKELTRVIQISNIIFTVVFVVEMALKLLALSWTGYFMDRNNLLDFFIVFIR